MKSLFSCTFLVVLVILFAELGFGQVKAEIENSAEAAAVLVRAPTTTATVVRIDYENRTGMLRLTDGTTVTFSAGPELEAFDQIKLGEEVLIRN